jgi:hypothetical protein
MRNKLSLIDFVIISIEIVALYLGARTMLEIPTLIIPSWFLIIIYDSILLLLSYGFSVLIISLAKLKIKLLTANALIVTVVCLSFYVSQAASQAKSIYRIHVPENFVGEVRLFRSTLSQNRLHLNKFGVGYITENAYQGGFKPVIYQGSKDITRECKDFAQGSIAFAGIDGESIGPFSYMSFTVKNTTNDTIWTDVKKVVEARIIDVSIMKK